ncbi:calcium transport factor [Schizosaccharomyces osmophilus]|uniref:Calcium transport factor n=1 Tax=Schizosaccharomyces osmophilus TaxID=2545709 RepID=A0AAF0AWF4_9SCHI|nr:calcium transport factor [Schizosaccharomyces osmophilus]WBW73577.1 calcium transport factor [Schizosaccharomyces osmophilus]
MSLFSSFVFLLFLVFYSGDTLAYSHSLDRIQVLTFSTPNLEDSKSKSSNNPQLKCSGSACEDYETKIAICQHNQLNISPLDLKWSCSWPHMSDRVHVADYDVHCKVYYAHALEPIVQSCTLDYRLEYSTSGLLLHQPWKLFAWRPFSAGLILFCAGVYLMSACMRILGYLGAPRTRFHDSARWNEQKYLEQAIAAADDNFSGRGLFSNSIKQRVPMAILEDLA